MVPAPPWMARDHFGEAGDAWAAEVVRVISARLGSWALVSWAEAGAVARVAKARRSGKAASARDGRNALRVLMRGDSRAKINGEALFFTPQAAPARPPHPLAPSPISLPAPGRGGTRPKESCDGRRMASIAAASERPPTTTEVRLRSPSPGRGEGG